MVKVSAEFNKQYIFIIIKAQSHFRVRCYEPFNDFGHSLS